MADPNATGNSGPGVPDGARRRPWWRRGHVPFIVALALLAPLTYGTPWWLEYRKNVAAGRLPPTATPVSGDTASLAGSRWEYFGVLNGGTENGVTGIHAVFAVTPQSSVAAERVHTSCRPRAVDNRGRTWRAGLAQGVLPEFADSAGEARGGRCETAEYESPPKDETTLLLAHFRVPKDAVDGLRFEVEVATHNPTDPSDIDDEELLEPDAWKQTNPPEPAAVSFDNRKFDGADLAARGLVEE